MMKKCMKCLCLGLALVMLAGLLCACGGGETTKSYMFVHGGVTLKPSVLAEACVNALGEPKNYSESGSCGGIPGMDKVYVYAGFTVYTTPAKEGDIIAKIELTDDSVKTPEGLTIGSDKQAVTDALGVGENIGGNLVYTAAGVKLTFVLRDGKVTNIQYATT